MAVTAARVTVGTSAVALNTASPGGERLVIKNGAAIIALGPAGVTTGTGFELAAAATIEVELDSGDVLFAICGTSSIVQILGT